MGQFFQWLSGLLILYTIFRFILISMIPKFRGKYRKIRPVIEINPLCNGEVTAILFWYHVTYQIKKLNWLITFLNFLAQINSIGRITGFLWVWCLQWNTILNLHFCFFTNDDIRIVYLFFIIFSMKVNIDLFIWFGKF